MRKNVITPRSMAMLDERSTEDFKSIITRGKVTPSQLDTINKGVNTPSFADTPGGMKVLDRSKSSVLIAKKNNLKLKRNLGEDRPSP